MSLLQGFSGDALLLPAVALPVIVAYNVPVSFYAWRRQPLGNKQVGRLLFGDLVQSTLTVAPGYVALSAHVLLADQALSETAEVMTALKHILREQFDIEHTTIQLECTTCG